MLTDAEKERVRAEEVFREEVRRSLQPLRTRWQRLYDFLNSTLGIFLLSSVLVTGLSGAYTWYSQQRQEKTATFELQRKLDAEIAYRLTLVKRLRADSFDYLVVQSARSALVGRAASHP